MRTICYYPELVEVTGSVNAALMMAQLEFWFKVMEGKPFYKFLDPCSHELYKVGDSWSEELGMTSCEIRSAFKRIGTMYKSKSAFLESKDVFKGKPYAAYYDRIRKTTYYLRNEGRVEDMMPQDIFPECLGKNPKRDSSAKEKITKGDGFIYRKMTTKGDGSVQEESTKREEAAQQDADLTEGKMDTYTQLVSVNQESASGLYREDYRINNIENSIQESRQEEKSILTSSQKTQSHIPFTEVMKLYNEHLGEKLGYVTHLTHKEKGNIQKLWHHLNMSLEDFKKAFMKVAASKFLCGKVEGKKWRASLKWLLTEEHLMKVLQGFYDDFERSLSRPSSQASLDRIKSFNQMQSHHFDFGEIERLERLYIDHKLQGLLGA